MGLSSSSQTLCLYVYSECQMQNVLPDFRNEIIIIFKMMFQNISHFAYNNYIFIFIIFYFNFYIVRVFVCLFCEEKQQHLFFCSKQMWTKPISIPYNHQMTMIIILMTMLLLLLFFSFNNKQKKWKHINRLGWFLIWMIDTHTQPLNRVGTFSVLCSSYLKFCCLEQPSI